MLSLMIDTHGKESTCAMGIPLMGTLSGQIGKEHYPFSSRNPIISTGVQLIPTGGEGPTNPIQRKSRVLHCCHCIPVHAISCPVQVSAACWINNRVC